MAIIHVHIEKTGGTCLQNLYIKKYPKKKILWYSVRDNLFAPISIQTANYTKDWQLKPYAFISRHLPFLRHLLIWIRTIRRRHHSVSLDKISSQALVVIGHFAASKLLLALPPDQHEYRAIIRHPLVRMWSHFNYFCAHNGDVGHRLIPKYKEGMTFEEFAMSPEMKNYQTGALGSDISIYKHIGITEKLDSFTRQTGLVKDNEVTPIINSFKKKMPNLSKEFIKEFETAHALDYKLYDLIFKRFQPIL